MEGALNSFGLVCCRRNTRTGRLEVLLVRKKYTYAYFDFLHGKYERSDIAGLLDRMTSDEKYAILSMNFDIMYARVSCRQDMFYLHKHRTKFNNNFGGDGGKWLANMISRSAQHGGTWEIPKGRKSHNEHELDAACREFTEETSCAEFKIVPWPETNFVFQEGGVKYAYTFWLAVTKDDMMVHLDLNGEQGKEVSELDWFDLQHVALLDTWIGSIVKKAFAWIKKYDIV